jgi:polar amino acid transport system substrate-binding protein
MNHKIIVACCAMAFSLRAYSADATLHFVTEPFPPFSYEENGVAAGPMNDVILSVCKAAGVTCDAVVMPFRRAIAMGELGVMDGIFSIRNVPERKNAFYLSDPIVKTGNTFFVVKNSSFFYRKPADLDGMTVAVYGPSATLDDLQKLVKQTRSTRIEVEVDMKTALRKLEAGRYGANAAVLLNIDVGVSLMKQLKIEGLKPAGDATQFDMCFGLSRKKVTAQQAEKLNQALRKLKAAGTIKAILEKYNLTFASN